MLSILLVYFLFLCGVFIYFFLPASFCNPRPAPYPCPASYPVRSGRINAVSSMLSSFLLRYLTTQAISTYSPLLIPHSTFPLYCPCVSASVFSDLMFLFTYLGFFFSLLSTSLLISSSLMRVGEGSVVQLLFGGWDLCLVSLLSRHPVPLPPVSMFPVLDGCNGLCHGIYVSGSKKKSGGPSLLWLLPHPTLFFTLFYSLHHLAHRRRSTPFNTPREPATLPRLSLWSTQLDNDVERSLSGGYIPRISDIFLSTARVFLRLLLSQPPCVISVLCSLLFFALLDFDFLSYVSAQYAIHFCFGFFVLLRTW
jgi:hypothetical protein